MTEELSTSIESQIIESHRRVVSGSKRTIEAVLETVNAARECGIHIIMLCEQERRSVAQLFNKSVTSYRFEFGYETAHIYRRFAQSNPEPITHLLDGINSLKDALVASGSLKVGNREHQMAHSGNPVSFIIQLAGRFQSQWKKCNGQEFIDKLSPEGREQAIQQIKPAKDLILAICDALGC